MSPRPSTILVLSVLGSTFAVAGTPACAAGPAAPTILAASALGDLASFRAIAADTLALVDKGDIPAARARVKDLETAWDKAESTLEGRGKAIWTEVDGMIDSALTDLRVPNPKPAACQASLRALMAKLDGLDHA